MIATVANDIVHPESFPVELEDDFTLDNPKYTEAIR